MFKRMRVPLTVLIILLILASAVFAQNGSPVIFKKYISVGGGSFYDGNLGQVPVGYPVTYKFEVINPVSSGIHIGEMKLIDPTIDLDTTITIPSYLNPGESHTTGIYPGGNTLPGFQTNTATFSATAWVYSQADWVYYSPSDYVYLTDTAGYHGHTFVPNGTTPTHPISPSITVKKHISTDGGVTWLDAETAPGPSVNEGTTLQFRFVVTNTGNVFLTNLTLIDSDFNVSAAVKKDPLLPGESFQYIHTGMTAVVGQHENTATATGAYGGVVYSDSDKAHYTGVKSDAPSISVKKYVSVDGGSKWDDAQLAPGPSALVGNKVQFKFVVTNTGNVPLTDLTLTDSKLSLSGATKPASLLPASSFEYVLTGVDVKEGQQENTATATGKYGSITYSASDKAHYKGEKTIADAPGEDKPVTPTPPTGGHLSFTGAVGLLMFAGGILLRRRKLNLR